MQCTTTINQYILHETFYFSKFKFKINIIFCIQLKEHYDAELSNLCQQLLSVQALMLREQNKVETFLIQKDQLIVKQKQELDKLSKCSSLSSLAVGDLNPAPTAVSVVTSSISPVTLGGSLRIHGSFRQYKKDREKIRQHLKSSTTTLINDSSSR